ncbi:MAG: phosphoribosylformylglycinamidine synthase subunit PurS [Methylobacteriaceae bacterium]|nr:phosphoribosylformylglycinamidine synthase subunit PurS [Methylobacteriaceae bacterium]
MKARVTVTLKPGVLDPQGKAIEGALASLGIAGIASVRQGKLFDVELADGVENPEALLARACETLLANTVVESYRIALEAAPPRPAETPLPAEDAHQAEAAEAAAMPPEGHP